MASIQGDTSQNQPLQNGKIYEFGPFQLDVRQGLLLRGGQPVKISRKTFELLVLLVRNNNQIVDKNELMRQVWQDSFVEDANLTVHISKLRRIFSAEGDSPAAVIETFPKVGYRFSADVREVENRVRDTHGDIRPAEGESPQTEQVQLTVKPSDRGRSVTEDQENPAPPRARWAAGAGTKIFAATVVLALTLVGSGLYFGQWFRGSPFESQTMTRVPGTEQSSSIALSPSGEYIAHAISKAGKRTLTMTHITSGSSIQLLPADEALFHGMTFSRDGSQLYFVKQAGEHRTLFRIPFLGGPVTKVLDNVENKISFSPDGSSFCFVRKLPENETAIIVANTDGTGERIVARRRAPDFYSTFEISWSPDGKLIANVAGTTMKDQAARIVGVNVETGEEQLLSESQWSAGDGLEWLPDGSGLIAGLFERPNAPTQVWLIPYPSGEPRRITNDLNNYGSVGVSADGKTVMAGQFKDHSSLWIVPHANPDEARSVTSEKHHLFRWVRWAPNGTLLFGSTANSRRDVWVMNPDGSGQRQLTSDDSTNVMPIASPDGRHIVFASTRAGKDAFNLWRTEANGGGLAQLTAGNGETQPEISPDGKWVFYTSGPMDGPPLQRRVWRISLTGGGEPDQLTDAPAYAPDVSPDGRYVACWYKADNQTPWKVAIIPAEGGRPVKLLDIPQTNAVRWTPDGKGISFVKTADGVSNVWTQDLNGGPPVQVTKFTTEQIFNFDWFGDGRLVCSRIFKTRDIVLIRNFR